MKYVLWLFLLVFGCDQSFGQSSPKPVYVIVHGAWGGGWAFKKVDSLLMEKGAVVYRPSLTAQGERVHLASDKVGLNTHILDVVNLVLYEDIRDVILVGHSYGGMVITGVADSVPGRIQRMIYLDAFVPENGESVVTMQGAAADGIQRMARNEFIIPPWVPAGKSPPKDVPHPLKTFTDTLWLRNESLTRTIPVTYIQTVAKGVQPSADDFAKHAERAKKKSWPVVILEADHNPQWSAPDDIGGYARQIWLKQTLIPWGTETCMNSCQSGPEFGLRAKSHIMDKKKNNDLAKPDKETQHKTDPQDNMKGPVSSIMQNIKEDAEENDEESKEEADKKKEENM